MTCLWLWQFACNSIAVITTVGSNSISVICKTYCYCHVLWHNRQSSSIADLLPWSISVGNRSFATVGCISGWDASIFAPCATSGTNADFPCIVWIWCAWQRKWINRDDERCDWPTFGHPSPKTQYYYLAQFKYKQWNTQETCRERKIDII